MRGDLRCGFRVRLFDFFCNSFFVLFFTSRDLLKILFLFIRITHYTHDDTRIGNTTGSSPSLSDELRNRLRSLICCGRGGRGFEPIQFNSITRELHEARSCAEVIDRRSKATAKQHKRGTFREGRGRSNRLQAPVCLPTPSDSPQNCQAELLSRRECRRSGNRRKPRGAPMQNQSLGATWTLRAI